MEPNNAIATCCLRASATNEKLKQDAKIQVADVKLAMAVIFIILLGAKPQHYNVSWKEGASE